MSSNDQKTKTLLERYKLIRAAHTCYYAQVDCDISTISPEFFFLVGDILEGKPLDKTHVRCVDLQRIKNFLKDNNT